jgi:thioredoxin
MAQNVTAADFKAEVLDSTVPVLVDFYADWCGPCRALAPVLDEIAATADGKYKIVKVDAQANESLANEYGVNALPTLLIVKDGQVTSKLVGLQPKARLVEALGG